MLFYVIWINLGGLLVGCLLTMIWCFSFGLGLGFTRVGLFGFCELFWLVFFDLRLFNCLLVGRAYFGLFVFCYFGCGV